MTNGCILPDMQRCVVAALEQQLHSRPDGCVERDWGTIPKYGSASRQENDTSKCEVSHHLGGRLKVGQRGSHLTLEW